MGLISSLFRPAPLKAFAEQMVEDIVKRYPQRLDADAGKRPSVNRLTRIVEDVCNKAQAFQQEHKLGWLGKARLSNTFKWALKERGYQDDFVNLATEALVVYLSKPMTVKKNA